ncbi:MAG: mechanosensitive ion channel family protein [candidate division WOR-3 bacterium]
MFWHELGKSLQEQFFDGHRFVNYARSFINVILVIVVAWLVTRLFNIIIRGLLRSKRPGRFRTVMPLVQSLFGYVVLVIALIMVLRVIGVDYKAILAGAGVLGLAIGFGAQTLVKDFISGFFTLFEGAIAVGDYITTPVVEGVVEKIGLRTTQVRAFDGTLWTIPNGELTSFGNRSREFMRAIVTFDVAYEQNPERAMAVAQEVALLWYEENKARCLEPPLVQGLINFGDSGMGVRIVCKVKPMEQWQAERELRMRLKRAFDQAGVEIPFPRRVIYQR